MIAQHVDAIILDSNSETGLNATISAANKAGIVVVASNDRVTSKDAVQIETVGEKFGAAGMKGFVKLLDGKGNIVILRGLPATRSTPPRPPASTACSRRTRASRC